MNDFLDLREKLSILWESHSLQDDRLTDVYEILDKLETDNKEKDKQIHRYIETLNHLPNPVFEEDYTGARIIIDSLREEGVKDVEAYLHEHLEIVEEICRSIPINEANYASLALYGIDSFEEFYTNAGEIVDKASYGDFIKQFMAIIDGADYFEQEMENKNALSELEYLILTLSVIDRERFGLSRVLVTSVDISDLKRIQKHKAILEERLALAKQFETLGKLAGGVAHDLNNVLIGLVSYPDMLMFGMSDDDPMKEPLKTIKGAGDDATNIIQDLLTLSRRSATVYEPIDMNQIIKKVLDSEELLKHLQEKRWIEIKQDLEADLPLISGSGDHLRKMILNLVINAIEAQEMAGAVTIKTCMNNIDSSSLIVPEIILGPYIMISVTDTGNGLTQKEISQIFEPFYSKKTLGYNVSGIGMTVVEGVVQEHQGYISVKAHEGEGSSFTIYLPAPLDISFKETSDSIVEVDIKGNGESILVVDDMNLQRSVTLETLERLGYVVEGSSGGEAALKRFTTAPPPDLVLLDMIMPGMDGLETCISMLQHYPHQRIVLLSGFAESERVNEALKRGALGFIRKPYTVKKLGLEIANYLKSGERAK